MRRTLVNANLDDKMEAHSQKGVHHQQGAQSEKGGDAGRDDVESQPSQAEQHEERHKRYGARAPRDGSLWVAASARGECHNGDTYPAGLFLLFLIYWLHA